jgi:hypothetical protein
LIGPERDHTTRLLYGASVLDKEGHYSDASVAAARTEHPVRALEATRYVIFGWQALLLLGLIVGILRVAWTRPALLAVLLIVPIYVLALSGGPEASPRFRVLYLPIFSLLTAVGARTIATYRVSWNKRAALQMVTSDLPLQTDATPRASVVMSA